jgi:hypothetical protein
MIYVRLTDRLGNQMFQYAAARALAERRGTGVAIDLSAYRHPRAWSNYQLWRFPKLNLRSFVPQSIVNLGESIRAARRPLHQYSRRGLGFDHSVVQLPDRTLLHGYFTSEQYFSDHSSLIRQLFDTSRFLPESQSLEAGNGRPIVSIHVRRGDYVGNELFNIGKLDAYYRSAMAEIRRDFVNARFCIFSDDPDWCMRWTVLKGSDCKVIGHRQRASPLQDLASMAACQHHIISNSTFAWWGAWLGSNPHKRVFLPSRWLNQWSSQQCGLSVSGWTEVDP